MRDNKTIIASSCSVTDVDHAMIKSLRGFSFRGVNSRITAITIISVLIHGIIIYFFNAVKVKQEEVVIEQIPERFARLIIEKPLPPKSELSKKRSEPAQTVEQLPGEKAADATPSSTPTVAQRRQAQKSVETRTARVEEKIRTVGVLGMLTGVGSTAKGPSVTDVLGAIGDKKDKFDDLDKALEKMSGLKKAPDVEILDKKLVKSKEVAISHKEEIDDLIAGVGVASSVNLTKQGNFLIQRPESIEGAASSSAKRDNDAINEIVSSHKASIRMSYERFLKRDPSLAGKVTVRFTIAASGSITNASIIENTTGNQEFEQELLRKVRMWKFDSIPDGDVTVTYPFVFSSSG